MPFVQLCAPRLLDRTRPDLLGWLADLVCDLVRARGDSGWLTVLCRLERSVSLVTVPSASWKVTLFSLFGGGSSAGDGEADASITRCCRSAWSTSSQRQANDKQTSVALVSGGRLSCSRKGTKSANGSRTAGEVGQHIDLRAPHRGASRSPGSDRPFPSRKTCRLILRVTRSSSPEGLELQRDSDAVWKWPALRSDLSAYSISKPRMLQMPFGSCSKNWVTCRQVEVSHLPR